MIRIAPSILSANFAALEGQLRMVERGGADWIHLDVMDGHFVPNITFGPIVIKAIRTLTRLPLDTHLMINSPERFIDDFKMAGADRLTVHVEACPHLHRTIEHIRTAGLKAGVSLNPASPVSSLKEILPFVDLVLVMTVNPGFGGQSFIESMISKIREVKELVHTINPQAYIEVDGGVDRTNASRLVASGANVLVAGHSIFSRKNISQAVHDLRKAASE